MEHRKNEQLSYKTVRFFGLFSFHQRVERNHFSYDN